MNTNKISVIIILYYSKHLLFDIISNTKEKIEALGEIILINNSGENLEEFRSNIISIIYPKKNLGYGAGINLGVKNSKYQFLLILNPDLYIQKFDISLNNFQKEIILSGHNPNMPGYYLKFPSLWSTFIEHAVTSLIYVKLIEKIIHFRKLKSPVEEVKVDYVSGALIFTNKNAFEKIGGFDESFFLFYEETDFCKRASKLNIPVFCTSKILYNPIVGKSSVGDVRVIKIKSEVESSKKYHYKYNGHIKTQFTFLLLKFYFFIMVFLLIPLSYINKKFKVKKDEFIFRMKFF